MNTPACTYTQTHLRVEEVNAHAWPKTGRTTLSVLKSLRLCALERGELEPRAGSAVVSFSVARVGCPLVGRASLTRHPHRWGENVFIESAAITMFRQPRHTAGGVRRGRSFSVPSDDIEGWIRMIDCGKPSVHGVMTRGPQARQEGLTDLVTDIHAFSTAPVNLNWPPGSTTTGHGLERTQDHQSLCPVQAVWIQVLQELPQSGKGIPYHVGIRLV